LSAACHRHRAAEDRIVAQLGSVSRGAWQKAAKFSKGISAGARPAAIRICFDSGTAEEMLFRLVSVVARVPFCTRLFHL